MKWGSEEEDRRKIEKKREAVKKIDKDRREGKTRRTKARISKEGRDKIAASCRVPIWRGTLLLQF
jgi:hypothetical protein